MTLLKITHILSDLSRTSAEETQDFYSSLVLKLLFCKEFEDLPRGLIFTPLYTINQESLNFFCEGPDGQSFRLCGPLVSVAITQLCLLA